MKKNYPLTIVQVNTLDVGGGAAKVAFSLHQEYKRLGHKSIFLVGKKCSNDKDVIEIKSKSRSWQNIVRGINYLGRKIFGWQNIFYPESHQLSKLTNGKIDLFHFHNLHGGYFDISALPKLSQIAPVLITLHDMWLLTGHCSHSFDCEKWKDGCKKCLNFPAVFKGGSRFNWLRKKRNLFISSPALFCPSQWLLKKIKESYLKKFSAHLLYSGIDLEIFKPGSKIEARKNLGLPLDKKILVFVANGGLNSFVKGTQTLIKSFRYLVNKGDNIKLLVVGQSKTPADLGELNNSIIYRHYISDDKEMTNYYQASDVLVHPSLADNCPLTVLEAMACGIPVVASRVGGIPEEVEQNKNGILVESKNSKELTAALKKLLENTSLREEMGKAGREIAKERFDIKEQAKKYLEWYKELARGY